MKRMITNNRIKEFEIQLRNNEKSANTVEKYLRDVRRLCEFLRSDEVNKATVMRFKAMLVESYAITSVNSMIAAVNAFFRFMGWEDCCTKQLKLQKTVFCSEKKELTRAEYTRLVNTAQQKGNERLSMILQTICGTGIRVSELSYITVEAARRGEATVSLKGKTRSVFIVRELQKKLLRYAAEQKITAGAIFITRSGKPMSRTNIWREMKSLCEQAAVSPKKVFPHNLRHLFARTFYGIEKDIAKLADILGHSSINTTRLYIISTGAEHRKRMERMHLII